MKSKLLEKEKPVTDTPKKPLPFLYGKREYPTITSGRTTVCINTRTAPAKEYSPDD